MQQLEARTKEAHEKLAIKTMKKEAAAEEAVILQKKGKQLEYLC